jgi:saccharopine dehydrogenase (NAD+, L-lysine-forming)
VEYEGHKIIPLQFLKAVLPNPGDLGARTKGKTNIGDIITGPARDGSGEKTLYIYNICDHEECYREVGSQAVSYTTGVPAFIGAALMLQGTWSGAGVFNTEQLDPDAFMDMLNTHGLPWQIVELSAPVAF